MKKKDKEKKINPKNYIYSILIILVCILLVFYIFGWYRVKKEEKLQNSYLITSKTTNLHITSLDMLKEVLQETPTSYFLYISYNGDEDIYKFEKKLKRIIDKYKINDIFYFLDLTDIKNNNDNYLDEINEILNTSSINRIPALLYVDEGVITPNNVIDINIDNFVKILNNYDFKLIK